MTFGVLCDLKQSDDDDNMMYVIVRNINFNFVHFICCSIFCHIKNCEESRKKYGKSSLQFWQMFLW